MLPRRPHRPRRPGPLPRMPPPQRAAAPRKVERAHCLMANGEFARAGALFAEVAGQAARHGRLRSYTSRRSEPF